MGHFVSAELFDIYLNVIAVCALILLLAFMVKMFALESSDDFIGAARAARKACVSVCAACLCMLLRILMRSVFDANLRPIESEALGYFIIFYWSTISVVTFICLTRYIKKETGKFYDQ